MSTGIIINTTTETINLQVSAFTDTYSLSVINVEGPTRWGMIVGTLSAQTDLYIALSALQAFSYSKFLILSAGLDVTNTFLAANSGYWNTAYQSVSTTIALDLSSSLWNNAYTNLTQNSAAYLSATDLSLLSVSGNWNNAYNNLVSNSAAYLSAVDLSFLSVSGNWNNAYTNLTQNSAAYLGATDLSFLSVSSNWNDAYTNLVSNSAAYLSSVDLSFLSVSSNWNEAFNWTVSNSANATFETISAISLSGTFYGNGSNLIGASSPGQTDINTLVRSNSAEWNDAYSIIVSNSAAYLSAVDLSFLSVSGNWNNAYTSWNGASATSVVAFNDTRFSKLSSTAYTLVDATNSIKPVKGTNTASGSYSNVTGGQYNTASGSYSNVAGGQSNTASNYSSVLGGRSNSATGFSNVAGGYGNNASGDHSNISSGYNNTASGTFSFVGGGCCNIASGGYSSIIGGSYNNSNNQSNTFILGSNITALSANFTYVNNLSSRGTVNATSGNSNNWNDAYTNLISNSAAYLSAVDLSFLSVSSNWNDAYTNLVSNTAAYLSAVDLSFLGVSANWDSAYTTVQNNSSTTWNYQGTDLKNLSSEWVGGNSAYNNLVSNSAAYLSAVDLSFLSVSGNWNEGYSNLVSNSAAYLSAVDLSFLSVSGNWNDAYSKSTVYANNSASYATINYVDSNFFSLSGGIVNGETHFNGNVTVFGNLTATGTTTFANTIFSVTSALSVVHFGTGPAIYVGNDGSGDVASFYDIDQNIEVLHVGGINSSFPNVGVHTSAPNKTFTVVGEISATSDITTSGKIYIQGDGNSDQWSRAYTNQVNYLPLSGGTLSDKLGIKNVPLYFDLDTASLGNSYGDLGLGSSNNILINPNTNLILTQNVGNVGIGMVSPTTKLDVNGVITATGGNSNNWNTAYTISTAYQSASSSFATNTSLQATSALLTPLTTTNSLTGSLYTTIGSASALLTPLTTTNTLTGNLYTTIQSTSALLTPLTTTNTLTSQLVLNTSINTLTGNWNTSYQTISTIPYILNQTLSSVNTLFGSNTASGIFSEVLGGVCNTASGIYSTIVNAFSSCTTAPFTFVGSGSGNRVTGNYGAVIGGVRNTVSGVYGVVLGGICNTAACCGISSGSSNCAGVASIVAGTSNNALGNNTAVFGSNNSAVGPFGTTAGQFNVNCAWWSGIVNGVTNCITAAACTSFIGGGNVNLVSGCRSSIVGGRCNTVSSQYSSIVSGKLNNNPLFNSNIVGGSFNHTGGYCPGNITAAASISGNGTNTSLILAGIGSCFSTSGTTGAVSLMWMTSGTANASLSNACFTTANVVTNAANCIIINGDYSTCTATGLSACNIYVYDRCANIGGCNAFIGGGTLNTASGCYSFVGGGFRNIASSTHSIAGGCGSCAAAGNFAIAMGDRSLACGANSIALGGVLTCATGGRAVAIGGQSVASGFASFATGNFNTASGNASVVGGCCNTASGTYSTVAGGVCNTNSGRYSFVAAGSGNDTKGFANTFILGTALSATQTNTTYVNNISAQGIVYSNPPVFSGYGVNQITFPAGSWTKVVIDTKETDTNNNFNTTLAAGFSGRFTPTIPGYYQLNGSIQLSVGAPATQSAIFAIYKNGIEFRRGSRMPMSTAGMGLTISQIVSANGTGDYFELYLNQGSSSTVVNENGTVNVSPQFNGVFVRSL